LPVLRAHTAVTEEQNSISVERGPAYTLAFVEFDSSGRLAKPAQLDLAIEEIQAIPKDQGALVVLFVHGWGHSAAVYDKHVIGFRDSLAGLSKNLVGWRVIGIYVGWPAKWLKGPFHALTFLDRNYVADRVAASCETREAFRHMQQAVVEARRDRDKKAAPVVAVAVGHSLGGKFLFVPMENRLDRESKNCEDGTPEPYPATLTKLLLFGDHVLLINPAQDVHDYEVFLSFAANHRDDDRGISIFSSEGDGVMRGYYRFGRTIRNLFSPRNWRHFYTESVGLGWKSEQVTHDLCLSKPPAAESSTCTRNEHVGCIQYGPAELRARTSDRSPFSLIRVDGRIIKGHSDIFNDTFRDFLIDYIADKQEGSCMAADPRDLAKIR
jgi:pimeloyl-ACP methyl ester carboxylesterase